MNPLEQLVAEIATVTNNYKAEIEAGQALINKQDVTTEEIKQHQEKLEKIKAKKDLLTYNYKSLSEEEQAAAKEADNKSKADGTNPQVTETTNLDSARRKEFYTAVINGDKSIAGNPCFREFTDSAALMGNFANAGAYVASEQLLSYFIQVMDDAFPLIGRGSSLTVRGAGSVSARELVGDLSDAVWDDEEFSNLTEDNIEIGRRNLTPHMLTKLVKIGRTLLYNDPSFESKVTERMTQAFGRKREKGMIRGTGNKQPLGICVEDDNGIPTSRFVQTATSLTIGYEDLINMYTSLKSAYRNRAVWVFHRDVLNDLMKLKDNADNYIWSPASANPQIAVQGSPGTLLGIPVIDNEYMEQKTSGAWVAGDYPVILADFSHYWHLFSENMQMQRLTELYATSNQVGLIAHMSVDGAPVLPEAFSVLKIKA